MSPRAINIRKQSKVFPLLEFKNISLIRGDDQKILDRISLTIHANENAAILGPNGAGKSSLIKLITREYYPFPDKDSVFKIWGQEVWDVFDLRALLGIVSGDLQEAYERDITGFETVLSGFFSSIGLYFHKPAISMKRKAEEIIDFLEISHLKNRKMFEMSTGEARRFLIGRALVHEPKALILDEPAASLDLHALSQFRNILRKIVRSGTNVILITHHLQDIIPEINRVILMKEGHICNDGPKETMLTTSCLKQLFGINVKIKRTQGYYSIPGF